MFGYRNGGLTSPGIGWFRTHLLGGRPETSATQDFP
jgi:hypothetical protein